MLKTALRAAPRSALRTAADEVAWRLRAATQRGGHARLCFDALTPADRDTLFDLFASSHASSGWLAAPEGIFFLRSLPIYATDAGVHAPLDGAAGGDGGFVTCAPESMAFVGATAGRFHEMLAFKGAPHARAFYTALGVPELTDGDVLARLVLPRFGDLDAPGRDAALEYARRHWERLRGEPRLLAALRAAPFLHAATHPAPADVASASSSTDLWRCEELLDPRNATLVAAFAGEAVFPAPRWATQEWLPLLRDAGLRDGLDCGAVTAAATRLEARAAAARGAGDAARATRDAAAAAAADTAFDAAFAAAEALTSHAFLRAAAGAHGFNGPALTALSRIAFAPAVRGAPGGLAAAPRAARCLARFSDAVLPDDWPLAWAAAPVLAPCAAPPPVLRAKLGVRSPPPLAIFAAHLHAAGADGGEAALASWPAAAGAPDAAFEASLAHLASIWDGLSAADAARLRGAACVPVANATRLVPPSRLFVRCRVDLAPLAFELPPALAQYAGVMRALGARDAAAPADALALLRACGDAPLGPDELRAALRCAHLLAEDATLAASGDAPVPDAAGALALARSCVHGGSASRWLLARVARGRLRFVHPALAADVALCARLGVPALEAVVVEALAAADNNVACDELTATPLGSAPSLARAAAAARLRAPEFAAAAAAAAAAASAPAMAGLSHAAATAHVAAKLGAAATSLTFVRDLRTRLLLLPRREDVTRASACDDGGASGGLRRPFFACRDSSRLLVAQPSPHVPPAEALSAAISAELGAPSPLPLAPLLCCAPEALPALAAALISESRGGGDDDDGDDAGAGTTTGGACEPGAPVSAAHAALLQLRPLRPFAAGETCAWQPPLPAAEAAAAAALARASGASAVPPPLRYARVVADARPSPGEAVFSVAVEVGPSDTRRVLSTELRSFRASGAHAGGSEQRDGVAAPSSAAEGAPAGDAPPPAAQSVSPAEAAAAVRSLLAAADVPLDLERGAMLTQLLALQGELRAARAAAGSAAAAAAEAAGDADVLSRAFLCPITQATLEDPVICSDGHTCAWRVLAFAFIFACVCA
jgi:sacsin